MSICTSGECSCTSFAPSRLSSSRCSHCRHRVSEHQGAGTHNRNSSSFCSSAASFNPDSQSTQRPSRVSSDRPLSPIPQAGLKGSFDLGRPCRPIQGNSSFDIHISVAHFRPSDLQAIKDHILAPQPTKSTECESSSQRSFLSKPKDPKAVPTNRRQVSYSGPTRSFMLSPNRTPEPTRPTLNPHSHIEKLTIERILTKQSKLLPRKRSKSPYSLSVSQSRSQTPLPRSQTPRKFSISRQSKASSRKSPHVQSPLPEEDRKSHQQRVYSEYYPGASFDSAPTSYQATSRIFEPEDDRLILHFTGVGHTNGLNSLCVEEQNYLLTGSSDYSIGRWRLPMTNADPYKTDSFIVRYGSMCEAEKRWRAHKGKVWSIDSLRNGRVCSGGDDGLVRIWSDGTGKEVTQVLKPALGPVKFISTLDKSALLLSNSMQIQSFDVSTCTRILSFPHSSIRALIPLSTVSFCTASEDMTVKLWDVRTGYCTSTLFGHSDSVNCVSPMSEFCVVSGSDDCSIRVWDLRTLRTIESLEGAEEKIKAVSAFSETLIFSGGESLLVWDRSLCRRVHTNLGSIRCMVSAPSARLLITAGAGCHFVVWRVLSPSL